MKKLFASFMALILGLGLILPTATQAADPKQPSKPPENVLKVIKGEKELSKFADMISSAGLESQFSAADGNLTVFAPSNSAVEKIPSDVMKKAKADKDSFKSFVKYYTIDGSRVFSGNIKGRRAGPSSGSGEMLGFDGMGKALKINDAEIVTPDLQAQNGVVHIINGPLVPPSYLPESTKRAGPSPEEMKAMEEKMAARHEEMMKQQAKKQEEAAKKEGDKKGLLGGLFGSKDEKKTPEDRMKEREKELNARQEAMEKEQAARDADAAKAQKDGEKAKPGAKADKKADAPPVAASPAAPAASPAAEKPAEPAKDAAKPEEKKEEKRGWKIFGF